MKTWSDFHAYYLNDLADCTFFAAENEIRQAAREFCEKSRAWRVRLDPITTVAGVPRYDFDRTNEMELVQLLRATLNGNTPLDLLPNDVGDTVRGVLALSPREFELRPLPRGGDVLQLTAAMQPSNTAKGLDDVLFSMFADAISLGAKARLLDKDGKPYSNPAKAAQYRERFEAKIADAMVKAAKSFSSAALRTRASFM